jgi:hypothetical protein
MLRGGTLRTVLNAHAYTATACTVCPARAGAISAILPATATDWSLIQISRIRYEGSGTEKIDHYEDAKGAPCTKPVADSNL